MDETRRLARFSISPVEGGYRLQLEDQAGGHVELFADEAQIDGIIEALDDFFAGAAEEPPPIPAS